MNNNDPLARVLGSLLDLGAAHRQSTRAMWDAAAAQLGEDTPVKDWPSPFTQWSAADWKIGAAVSELERAVLALVESLNVDSGASMAEELRRIVEDTDGD